MRLIFLSTFILLLLSGCGTSPEVALAPKLSAYTTAQQQCRDFIDGKEELTTEIEKGCDDFLKRLEAANKTARKLESGKLKKGERQQTKLVYARQRNKVKQHYSSLSKQIKAATLAMIKKDDVEKFTLGIDFPGNPMILPYYNYMKSKSPRFDKDPRYISFEKRESNKIISAAEVYLKKGETKKALALFVKAAKMNNAQAARQSALLYEKSDEKRAFEWHQKAVEGGVIASYFNLGQLSEAKGDKKSALEFYTKGAEAGDAQAQFKLYHYYKSSDKTTALAWLKKSSDQGYVQAQYQYGIYLMQEKERKKSLALLQQAAQHNFAPAIEYLGQYYYDLKLYVRAFKLLEQSDSANSFYLRAKMLEEGAGQRRDYAKAFTFYSRADSLGKEGVKADMKRVNALLSQEEQRIAQEEAKAEIERMAKLVKQCGVIPDTKNITKGGTLIHLVGTASAPVSKNGYIIYGIDGEDYFVVKARGFQADDRVDISVKASGRTATLESADDGEARDVYQFTYLKPCVLEEE